MTYTGTVTDDYDLTGEFGVAGGSDNLVGDAYTAKYVFDTSLGATYSSAIDTYVYGGSDFGDSSPVVSASVTVNGHSQSIVGSYFSEIYGQFDYYHEQYHLAENYSVNNGFSYRYLQNSIYGADPTMPETITGPFTFSTNANDAASGTYFDDESNYETGEYAYTYVQANIATLTVSSGVPEPGTWALLTLGFAGLGFAGYRKSKIRPASFVAT